MPTELMHGQPVRQINVLALTDREDGQHVGELFKLGFSEADESLYLRPIAPTGNYWFGADVVPAGEMNHVIRFREHHSELPAKLSIHASGQVHVKLDGGDGRAVAGPVMMPQLRSMRDKHVATVWVDRFGLLAPLAHETTIEGEMVDFAFPFGTAEGGRVALYVNGVEPVFQDTDYWVRLERGGGELFVGFAGLPSEPLGPDASGFTVLSGWDPREDRLDVDQNLIFIRCQ